MRNGLLSALVNFGVAGCGDDGLEGDCPAMLSSIHTNLYLAQVCRALIQVFVFLCQRVSEYTEHVRYG